MNRLCSQCSHVGAERRCCSARPVLCRVCNDRHQAAEHSDAPQPKPAARAPAVASFTMRAELECASALAPSELAGAIITAELGGRTIIIKLREIDT